MKVQRKVTCITQRGTHVISIELHANDDWCPEFVTCRIQKPDTGKTYDPRSNWDAWVNNSTDHLFDTFVCERFWGAVYIQKDLPYLIAAKEEQRTVLTQPKFPKISDFADKPIIDWNFQKPNIGKMSPITWRGSFGAPIKYTKNGIEVNIT